jgi:hypothetical protein
MGHPPPWWKEPLDQWARELRQHTGVGLDDWMRENPNGVEAFMSGFIRSDGPRVKPWTEPVYRLRPRGKLTEIGERRRVFIDTLSVEQQRLICAAGRLLWRAAAAASRRRALGDDQRQAVANAVGLELIDEMRDLGAGPRLVSVQTLTLMFVGARPSMRQMQKHVKKGGANRSGTKSS